jgi:hypothetical protein
MEPMARRMKVVGSSDDSCLGLSNHPEAAPSEDEGGEENRKASTKLNETNQLKWVWPRLISHNEIAPHFADSQQTDR